MQTIKIAALNPGLWLLPHPRLEPGGGLGEGLDRQTAACERRGAGPLPPPSRALPVLL